MTHVKQSQYSGSFTDCLEKSRPLTKWVCKTLDDTELFPNIFCQDQFDQTCFVGNGGTQMRFADIIVLDFNTDGGTFFVECKDFGSMIHYDCTGLPQRYIDKKMFPLGIKHVYIVFIENRNVIEARKKFKKKLFFVEEIDNKTVRRFPYGERLDILMRNRDYELEKKVKCKLSSYYDEPQYLWKLEACKPIKEIFVRDFGNIKLNK